MKSDRAYPNARRIAWAVLALGLAAGGADAVSRYRHATFVDRSRGAVFLTGGTLIVIAIHDSTSSVIRPAPGFSWTDRPSGYGVGSSGVPATEMVLPFIKTTRDSATGGLQWSVTTLSVNWVWGAASAAGVLGLIQTRRRRSGLCPACGYELGGLPPGSARCPECGGPLTGRE